VELDLRALHLREYLIHGIHNDRERRKVEISRAVHIGEHPRDECEAGKLDTHLQRSADGDHADLHLAYPLKIQPYLAGYSALDSGRLY